MTNAASWSAAERGKGNHSVRADHDETPKAMPNARKTSLETGTDSIFQREMTAFNTHSDPVTVEGNTAVRGLQSV
jgi:hypothetical protein